MKPATLPVPRIANEGRFWSKVEKTSSCWNWIGAIGSAGYGNFGIDNRTYRAHRVSYEWLHGPIPAGLVIDHLCRNKRCVNPDHLEPVTDRVNTIRGDGPRITSELGRARTHCKHGHSLSGANLYVQKKTGYRYCRECMRQASSRFTAKNEAKGYVRGESSPNAKLTEEAVRDIRSSPNVPLGDLAKAHGVSRSSVWLVRTGRTWAHILDHLDSAKADW